MFRRPIKCEREDGIEIEYHVVSRQAFPLLDACRKHGKLKRGDSGVSSKNVKQINSIKYKLKNIKDKHFEQQKLFNHHHNLRNIGYERVAASAAFRSRERRDLI